MSLESGGLGTAGRVGRAAEVPRASPHPARLSMEEAQTLRIRRFFLAVGTSMFALGMFFACYLAGLISAGVLLNAIAMTLACAAVFYVAFRSNFNLRFAEPTLLLPQAACAIAVSSYVMAYAGPGRPLLMLLYFAALMFYAFRFSRSDFAVLCIYTLACYALSVWAARYVDPQRSNSTIDLLQGVFLLIALPWTGWFAYYLSGLRRRIRTSEALYRSIWDTSIDAVLILDDRGHIRFANPSAAALFGHSMTQLIGTEFSALQPEERREELRREIARYWLDGSTNRNWPRFEDAILTRDGREVPVEAALAELGGQGGTGLLDGERRMVLFMRNISRRRALETIKDDFISTVSHEFRTPLMSVIGAVEALQAGDGGLLPETARALIGMAAQSADRLHQLIDTILSLQKIESGGISFMPEAVAASALIEKALQSEQGAAGLQHKRLVLADLAAGARVEADARWVHKVLVHLIDNALKFSPPQTTITMSAERADAVVRFMVSDQGSGVPPQFAGRIFTKFAQADTSHTRLQGGAGLGLSFCKSIVEGCGGRIGYHNNVERGATFWFELPQAR
ncbi:MAG: domain S-box protein [Betaproteobacteria bacterium]|nr:domain S-box protein [Betaproteobacteria bacterium]